MVDPEDFELPDPIDCLECDGSGVLWDEDGAPCPECDGQGTVAP